VNKFWFRFVFLDAKEPKLINKKSKGNNNPSKQPDHVGVVVGGSGGSGGKKKDCPASPVGSDDAIVEVIYPEKKHQVQQQSLKGKQNVEAIGGTPTASTSNVSMSNKRQKTSGNTMITTIPKSRNNPFHPPTLKHFDILTLRPLKSNASRKKKYVMLRCKGSNKVIVCFRGSADAAHALGMDRKTVIKICEQESKTKKERDGETVKVPEFDTFSLSFASSRSSPTAYLYGVHEEDWKIPQGGLSGETHFGRLERWEQTFSAERNTTSAPTTTSTTTATNVGGERINGIVAGVSGAEVGEIEGPNISKDSMTLVNQLIKKVANADLCIVCQNVRASIVFEPCCHCIICRDCFQNGYCKKFCPICRTDVGSTLSSNSHSVFKGTMTRPKIYSANLFM